MDKVATLKLCGVCRIVKPIESFDLDHSYKDGHYYSCKYCRSEYRKARRVADPDHARALATESHRRMRLEALTRYGGDPPTCACCGEGIVQFLAIDHVNGGGAEHRRAVGSKVHLWLKRNGWPDGYQVLCHNCNSAKGFYGTCPHQENQ